jgi:thiol:disulfide interchange protein DsbA
MDCTRIDSILDGHGAGALSAPERSALGAHLDACRRCADAWLGHERLAADAPDAPRPGLYREILAAVAAAPVAPAPARRAGMLGAAAALAATVLLAVVVLGLMRIDREVADPVPESATAAAVESTAEPATASAAASTAPGGLLGDTPIFEPAVPGLLAGIHYAVLPEPAPTSSGTDRIEVCEFFMFLCVHCYDFEPGLRTWEAAQGDEVALVRVPALFNPVARLHAQAFYTAEALGRGDALIQPFYDEVHRRGNPLDSVEAIRAFFGRQGIDAARFDASFASADVAARLAQAEQLNRLYRVNATPSIGVNGRYLTNASMAGSNAAMLEVVNALVEAEAEPATPECDAVDSVECRLRRFARPPGSLQPPTRGEPVFE